MGIAPATAYDGWRERTGLVPVFSLPVVHMFDHSSTVHAIISGIWQPLKAKVCSDASPS